MDRGQIALIDPEAPDDVFVMEHKIIGNANDSVTTEHDLSSTCLLKTDNS